MGDFRTICFMNKNRECCSQCAAYTVAATKEELPCTLLRAASSFQRLVEWLRSRPEIKYPKSAPAPEVR